MRFAHTLHAPRFEPLRELNQVRFVGDRRVHYAGSAMAVQSCSVPSSCGTPRAPRPTSWRRPDSPATHSRRRTPPAAAARRRSQHGASASAGLVSVVRLAPALADDVVCGSNRLTTFSLAGTVSPSNTRRLVCSTTRLSRATHFEPLPPPRRRSCGHQALVGGRPPLPRLQWSRNDTASSRSRASRSSRVSTRTPSYNRRLSDGSRISVSVTVLSIRACHPIRSPAAWRPATARR